MGCAFHWTQCLWRKVREIGLSPSYRNDYPTHNLLRQFLALPFLTSGHIPAIFSFLSQKATTPNLAEFAHYVRKTWIKGSFWTPRTWSVFMEAVRTNNDVEGWHGMLNRHAKGYNLSFYKLLHLLQEKSHLIQLQVRLLSQNKLKRRQRTQYRRVQGQLFELWDEYIAGNKTAKKLLKRCSHIMAPTLESFHFASFLL
ncbi:uncharacterized protein LOC143022320 [Oratosquilla oratoria]|uniref:uncharacterized protein LOC143022320 n=1 Tax=Oratosquilla oratoria TaxID=337810 RepID=UPI003F763AC9